MKKLKILKSLLLLLLAVIVLLSGCGKTGNPTVDGIPTGSGNGVLEGEITFPLEEEVTFRVITALKDGSESHDGKKMFEEIKQKTNVNIIWEHYQQSAWAEIKRLVFAGKDMPDMFAGQNVFTIDDIVSYAEQGFFIPLEGMIEEYAPNVQKIFTRRPDFKRDLTMPNGHIYSLFTFLEDKNVSADTLMINGNWLDYLKLEMPKTTDDFYSVLKAFKTGDPNQNNKFDDEIPFTFRHNVTGQGLMSMFGAFGIIDNGNHMTVKDDKVIYTSIQPEYRDGLVYFNKLFKEGLADVEALTHSVSVYNAKTTIKEKENMIAGTFVRWQNLGSFGGEDVGIRYVPPLEGPKGHRLWRIEEPELTSKSAFTITTVCKQPELALKWVDMFYDEKTSFEMKYGIIGDVVKENPDGSFEFMETPEGEIALDWRGKDINGMFIYNVWSEWTNRFVLDPIARDKILADEMYRPFGGGYKKLPNFTMAPDVAEEVSMLETDLKNFVNDSIAIFLLEGGAEDDSKWNAYLKKCEDMKMSRMLELYQQLYDRQYGLD